MRKTALLAICLLLSGCAEKADGVVQQLFGAGENWSEPHVNITLDPVMQCHLACAKIPHSIAQMAEGRCTCPCIMGYLGYNNTCITPREYEQLVPDNCPDSKPVGKHYFWIYRGREHVLSLCYANVTAPPMENRTGRRDYWNFVNDPYSNGPVAVVTDKLVEMSDAAGYRGYDKVGFAIAFVQDMPYTYDNVSTPYDDYPRFPSETIYADGGDCEDTSILMAAILRRMGYDTVLLRMPGHVAVGVSCEPSDFNYTVSAYGYNGKKYCYLETTGSGWKVGVLPDEHLGEAVTVIPLPGPQADVYLGWGKEYYFRSNYTYDQSDTYVNVTGLRVDNFGSLPAKNVQITVSLEAEDGGTLASYTLQAGDLGPRQHYEGYVTNLRVQSGKNFRVDVRIHGDNFEPVGQKGGWVTWH